MLVAQGTNVIDDPLIAFERIDILVPIALAVCVKICYIGVG